MGGLGPALLDELKIDTFRISLVTARLRLAAASGRYDRELLAMLDVATTAGVPLFDVLHAMRDPSQLATHAPRLELRLWGEEPLVKWLDRFGASRPDWIVDSINAAPTKKLAALLVAVLARTLASEGLAPIMQAIADCKAKPDVARWLARHASAKPTSAKTGNAKAKDARASGGERSTRRPYSR